MRHSILTPNPKRRHFALFSVSILLLCSRAKECCEAAWSKTPKRVGAWVRVKNLIKQYVYVYRSTLVSWTFLAVPALLTGWAFCSGLATLLPSRMLLRVVCCWLLWASSRCCGGLWSPSRRGCWLLWASSRWCCRPIATLSPPSLKTRIPVKDAVYRVLMIETNFHVTNRWWYWSE